MSWPVVVLLALSPTILLCVCAEIGLLRDRRRARRRAAMHRHPAVVGRQLQERRVVAEAERITRNAS